MTGDQHRIDGRVRMRAVAALAVDRDLDPVGGGHRRPRGDADAPRRETGPVVQREHLLGREALEEAVLDHRLRAGVALLARLEDQVRGAVEIARLVQVARRGEQHRRVTVVTAAVHPPVVARLVRERVLFLHRQRVHVGAEADRATARRAAAGHHGDDARATDADVVLDAERREPIGDDLRRPVLLEAQLWMHVEIATQRREFGVPAANVGDGTHGATALNARPRARRATADRPHST